MYMMPRRLWSTVVTHAWSVSTSGLRAVSRSVQVIDSVAIDGSPARLAKGFQVVRHRVHLFVAQLHGRHLRSGFDRVGVAKPQPELLRRVRRRSRRDRVATHQVGQIRAEAAVGAGSGDGVTVHAGGRL